MRKTKIGMFQTQHAFIIGINDYQHVSSLNTAVNDAQRLAKVLANDHKYHVHQVLLNPTGADLRAFLTSMKNVVGENDSALFYFAGHGIALEDDNGMSGYLVPADAEANKGDTLISMSFLNTCFEALVCRHFLLILDCCFAGSIRWATTQRAIGFLPKRIYKERFDRYLMDKAWQVLTSSSHDQKAFDYLKGFGNERDTEGGKHSPFALALFEALSGKADIVPADGGDGIMTATELYLYLRQEVEKPTFEANSRLRQTPSIFNLPKHDKGEFIFLAPNHRLNLPSLPKRNPFKGLQSFDEADKELFYGRERVVKDLLEQVKTQALTVVTGASGTGKSSLVKAGLTPLLKEQGYTLLPVIRPTQKPLDVLAHLVMPENKHKQVLIIDQFEELLTQSLDDDRLVFIDILRGYITEGLTVIVTVRSDFEPQFDMSDWAAWKKGRFVVPPFTVEELREVIVQPALQEVLQFDPPAFIDTILNEVVQSPGALPLLSFTLSELYEMYVVSGRNDRLLTESDYCILGGVIGSLRKKADKIYKELDTNHQDTMRNVMLRMVSIAGGEYAGKRVFKTNLIFTDAAETKRVETVFGLIQEARLIVSGTDNEGRAFVEPAHDALVRAWTKLTEWVKARGEENVLLQNKLAEAVSDYIALNNKDLLWHDDPRLDILRGGNNRWLNAREIAFIESSIKLKRRNRLVRNLSITIAFVLIAGAALYAFKQQKVAEDNTRKAEKETRTANNAAVFMKLKETDLTFAMRLMQYNYTRHSENKFTSDIYFQTLNNVHTGFYSKIFKGHTSYVNAVAYSPDGNTVATGSTDKIARLWDTKNSRQIKTFIGHTDCVYTIAFSPNGQFILTGSWDSTARLWNIQSGKMLKLFDNKEAIFALAFTPDGKQILTNSGNTIKLWNIQKGKVVKTFIGHSDGVLAIAFSPNGKQFVSAGVDNTAKLWDIEHLKPIRTFIGHTNGIFSLAFSPDGKTFVTGSADQTAKLWDIKTGKILKNFIGYLLAVRAIAFSPNGQYIATAGADNVIKLWDIENGETILTLFGHSDSVDAIAFSPDGNSLITASSDSTAKLWVINRGINLSENTNNSSNALAFSPNGNSLITGGEDKTAKLWDIQTKKIVFKFIGHSKAITSLAFSPDGKKVITGSSDSTAKLWDIQTGKIVFTFMGHSGEVTSVAFSPDGKKVITGSVDSTTKLWDIKSGQVLKTFGGHKSTIYSVSFSADGNYVMSSSIDTSSRNNVLRIWDIKNGQLIKSIVKNVTNSGRVSFSRDKKSMIIAESSEKLTLIDITNSQTIKTFEGWGKGINYDIIAFSPNGKQFAQCYNENSSNYNNNSGVKIYDIETGQAIKTFVGGVIAIDFSPDGKMIAASNGSNVKLWDIEKDCIECNAHSFSLSEMRQIGLKLEPDDLKLIWEKGEKLKPEELKLINNK